MQPASEYQKAVISKRWRVRTTVPDDADDRGREALDKLNRMTKGEAANIITRLKHGAQVRRRIPAFGTGSDDGNAVPVRAEDQECSEG